jgi:hypothetical protein
MSPKETMEAFFTRSRANEGVDVPLSLPDGTPTKHSIRVRGVDSDAFRAADAESRRKTMEAMLKKDEKATELLIRNEKYLLLSSLVVSWTFDMPCTQENVINFFREAPQIADAIDRLAANRTRFFKDSLTSSTPTPGQSSS